VSQQDQHLTTEQLSTLLDQQLTPEEQAYCSAHLAECEQCQDMLDNLQQMVNLLQSLPQLEVPRSFALPADFKITQITSDGNRQQQADQSIATPPRRLPTPLRRTLSTVSALVAVIGLFFALSGFVAIFQPSASMSAVPMANSTNSSAGSQIQQAPQTKSQITKGNDNNTADFSTPTVQATNKPQPQSLSTPSSPTGTNSTATWSILSFLDFNQSGVRLSIGILLIILGGMGFILFAQRLKQRNL
jgi:hypothetical protein